MKPIACAKRGSKGYLKEEAEKAVCGLKGRDRCGGELIHIGFIVISITFFCFSQLAVIG